MIRCLKILVLSSFGYPEASRHSNLKNFAPGSTR